MTKKKTESTAITVLQNNKPLETIEEAQEETTVGEISKSDEAEENDLEKPLFRFQKVNNIDAQTLFHLGLKFFEFESPDVFLEESLLVISLRKANKSHDF